ncbi:MAG: hypothetical protein ACRCY8_11470, partial [Dermatophilaceae bacterium]
LDLQGIPAELAGRVRHISTRLDELVPPLLGEEALAAARLLLTRAIVAERGVLARSDRDDIAAGAVILAVGKANDLVGSGRPVRPQAVQEVCGLRSVPNERARAFAHAVNGGSWVSSQAAWTFSPQPDVYPLGSPDLLLARFRLHLIGLREAALRLRAVTPRAG